jgi:hypothetical protein
MMPFDLDLTLESWILIVYNYHRKTVKAAAGIVGCMGKTSLHQVGRSDVMRRVTTNEVRTLSEQFPEVRHGCLRIGQGPERLQEVWDISGTSANTSRRWIF